MKAAFSRFATAVADAAGYYATFLAAVGLIVVWALTGPVFGFSDTWQLVINTGTTIITFLMVFLIQNTQNRDARAIHLKLDELINAVHDADNRIIDAEDEPEDEITRKKQAVIQAAKEHSS